MAAIACTPVVAHLAVSARAAAPSSRMLPARAAVSMLPSVRSHFAGRCASLGPSNGIRVSAFFNFGKDKPKNNAIYNDKDEYEADDVEHYFNYMGLLAVEGTYDRLEGMLESGTHPADLILLMAASEGDAPKIEELLAAGADKSVKDSAGKTPLELAKNDEIRQMLA